jgi:plastocyanin
LRLALTVGCAAAALALAACGSSSKSSSGTAASSSSTPTTSTPASEPAGGLQVEMADYRFQPAVIRGTGGDKVKVHLKNTGKAEHNFTVKSLGIDKDVEPGEAATVTVDLPKSGTVKFYCEYHRSKGMVGAVALGGASTPAPSTTNTDTSSSGGSGY